MRFLSYIESDPNAAVRAATAGAVRGDRRIRRRAGQGRRRRRPGRPRPDRDQPAHPGVRRQDDRHRRAVLRGQGSHRRLRHVRRPLPSRRRSSTRAASCRSTSTPGPSSRAPASSARSSARRPDMKYLVLIHLDEYVTEATAGGTVRRDDGSRRRRDPRARHHRRGSGADGGVDPCRSPRRQGHDDGRPVRGGQGGRRRLHS